MTIDSWPVQARSIALTIQTLTTQQLTWSLQPSIRHGKKSGLPVDLTPVRLAAGKVRRAISAMNSAVDPRRHFSSRYKLEVRQRLEREGAALAVALFGQKINEIAAEISDKEFHNVEITLHQDDLPIEFCVLPDPARHGQKFFLGERLLMVRRPPEEEGPYIFDKIDKVLGLKTRDREVGYAESDRFESACKVHATPTRPEVEEVYALSAVTPLACIDFLAPYSSGPVAAYETLASNWLARRRDVIHFNSHSESFPSERERKLDVRSRVGIGRSVFEAPGQLGAYYGTFFFLNACYSAFGSATLAQSICTKLLAHNAPAIACTLGPVDDALATRFATSFYERLVVPGTTVAQAIQGAKASLVASTYHPLSLMYSVMGDTQFTL